MTPLSRRDLLRAGAAAAAAAGIAPLFGAARSARATGFRPQAAGAAAPAGDSDVIRIGIVGMGVRARELIGQFMTPPCRVVGVCDVVEVRLADGVRRADEKQGTGSCRAHRDYRDLVARGDVDAIVITTPDHWHALPAIAAANAGKHVYCEKPLSLTIREGRAISNAATKAGIAFQTGSQQRTEFDHRFAKAVACVRGGRIGKVKRVEVGVGASPRPYDLAAQPLPEGINWEMWCGPSPMVGWHPDLCPADVHNFYPKWRAYREFSNGFLADMGAHHFDIAQWALDKDTSGPTRIEPPKAPDDHGLRFVYADGVELIHDAGKIDCHLFGTDGWIKVCRDSLEASKAEILEFPFGEKSFGPPPSNHIRNWVDAIRKKTPAVCPAETGHRSASICQLANIGYQLREPLTWDPAAEIFSGPNADVANALLERSVRPGFG